jgi:hypothetical protein
MMSGLPRWAVVLVIAPWYLVGASSILVALAASLYGLGIWLGVPGVLLGVVLWLLILGFAVAVARSRRVAAHFDPSRIELDDPAWRHLAP